MKCRDQQKKKMEMNSIQHWLSHGIVYLRNNSWGLEYILILPRVGPLCRYFTVYEQPKQIMTLPISWYTNIRIFYHKFGPKAFEGRHIRIAYTHVYIPSKFKCQLSFNWGLCIPVQMFFFFFQIERTLSTNFKIKNVRFVSANFYNSPSSLFCVTAKISNV